MEVESNDNQMKKYSPEKARKRYLKYKHIAQEYYQRNREAIRAKQKVYREKNKDRIREWQKNPKYRKSRNEWHENHREYTKEYHRKYYREVVKPKREVERKMIEEEKARLTLNVWISGLK